MKKLLFFILGYLILISFIILISVIFTIYFRKKSFGGWEHRKFILRDERGERKERKERREERGERGEREERIRIMMKGKKERSAVVFLCVIFFVLVLGIPLMSS